MDSAVRSQIGALRDRGKVAHRYGILVRNMPDYNRSQIRVDLSEVE